MQATTETIPYRFVRLNRNLYEDLLRGRLKFDEWAVLVWLMGQANPHNGQVETSYDALVKELRGKYRKNHINKIMLDLKRKQYLWFTPQQGSRSAMVVELHDYPLVSKKFTDISHRFNKVSGRSDVRSDSSNKAEVEGSQQKHETANQPVTTGVLPSLPEPPGRSPNNDKDKENNKLSIINKSLAITEYKPTTGEEQRCYEIAKELEEAEMSFILSAKRDVGLAVIENCYGQVKEAVTAGSAKDKRRLFNHLIVKHKFLNRFE